MLFNGKHEFFAFFVNFLCYSMGSLHFDNFPCYPMGIWRMGGGRTDVWKFTPVSYRTSALWDRCPKKVSWMTSFVIFPSITVHDLIALRKTDEDGQTDRQGIDRLTDGQTD